MINSYDVYQLTKKYPFLVVLQRFQTFLSINYQSILLIRTVNIKMIRIYNAEQSKQSNVVSVTDIISKFTIRASNSDQVCLTDRTQSASRNISTPKNDNIVKRRSLKHLDLSTKLQSGTKMPLVSQRVKTTTHSSSKSIFIKDIQSNTSRVKLQQHHINVKFKQKQNIHQPIQVVKDDKKIVERAQGRKAILRLMKQFNKNKLKHYQNGQKTFKNKIKKGKLCDQQRPLTQRHNYQQSQKQSNHRRSITGKPNIDLCIKGDQERLQRMTYQHGDGQNYFRKGSSASTLSLKTKHTVSMQHFEDYQELFSKESNNENYLQMKGKDKSQAIKVLEKVKQKIYQQIDSLDKKLLHQEIIVQKCKRPMLISLRRKKIKNADQHQVFQQD